MSQLICTACDATYACDDSRWRCTCGAPLDLAFEARVNREALSARKPTLWRYREALPIAHDSHIVSFDEGFTPLVQTTVYGKPLWLKQEQLFPSGSYKDRGASLLVSRAKELGVTRMVEDSSGNAGAAVAAYAAQARIACDIYVPATTSPAKLAQIQMYGATLHKVPGTREDTAQAALEAANHQFYASHVWNPFFFQGTKTYAYEIWEQLGFKPPHTLFVPTGNGTLLLGAGLGFQDLHRLGLISRVPRLIAVQSASCAPLYRMWQEGLDHLPGIQTKETIAEGIAIAEPARGGQIVDSIRKTGGQILTVTDGETELALIEACRQGWYIEPTAATVLAAFQKYPLQPGEIAVAPLTGHGLKSTEKLLKLAKP